MKTKLLLSVMLICKMTMFAQLPITQTFGNTSATPAGWTLVGDWVIDPGAPAGLFLDCNVAGSSAASKLFATNSTGGFSTATYLFDGTGKSAITISMNEYRDDLVNPTLTVLASKDNFLTTTTLIITEPSAAGVWAAVPSVVLPAVFDGQSSIQIRFQYTPNNTGFGIGIDDIFITGTSSLIFYNKASGAGSLELVTNWGNVSDGSGTPPVGFSTSGQVFNIVNGANASLTGAWAVSGTGSSIVVGDGITGMKFTSPSGSALTLTTAILTVQNASTLVLQDATNYLSAASTSLAANSTVDFAQASSVNLWAGATFQNLTLSGAAGKSCSGSNTISGILTLNGVNLSMAGNTNLFLNGTKTGTGKLVAALGNISIGGSGAFGTLDFSVASPTIKNLIINRASSGSVVLGSNLILSSSGTGTAAFTAGSFNLNGNSLTINRPVSFGGATIIGSVASSLLINSTSITGSLPGPLTLKVLAFNTAAACGSTGVLTIADSLSIKGGCAFTAGGSVDIGTTGRISEIIGSFSGNVSTSLVIPASASAYWRTFNSPIAGKTIGDLDAGGLPMTCLGCTNGPTSAGGYFVSVQGNPSGDQTTYTELIPSSSLDSPSWVYCGSSLTTFTGFTLPMTGAINQGNKAAGLFAANPYPSPLSATKMANSGSGAINVWNGTAFAPIVGGIGADQVAMGQSFYPTAAFTINEHHKTNGPSAIKKTATSTYPASAGTVFELDINSAYNELDKAYIRFHSSATNGFDLPLDAYKMYSTPGYAGTGPVYSHYTSICSINSNTDLSVNSIPYLSTSSTVIPVRVRVSYPGTFTITPVDIANLPATSCVTLFDKLLNVNHDLRTGAYVCNINDTTYAPRFELTICADITAGINNNSVINISNTLINQDVNGAYVKTNFVTNTKATISAFNVMGQKLMADKEIEGTELTTYLNLGDVHNQVVIIRVTTAKENTTKKIFIN